MRLGVMLEACPLTVVDLRGDAADAEAHRDQDTELQLEEQGPFIVRANQDYWKAIGYEWAFSLPSTTRKSLRSGTLDLRFVPPSEVKRYRSN